MNSRNLYFYVFIFTSYLSFISTKILQSRRKKIFNLFQTQDNPYQIDGDKNFDKEKSSQDKTDEKILLVQTIQKEDVFKYYAHVCKFKEKLLIEKWMEYNDEISRTKNFFKKEKGNLRKLMHENVFYVKFQELIDNYPEIYEFEDELYIAFMCFEKCIEVINVNVDRCASITFFKMFFEGDQKFLINRKGNYILKVVTLFLYALIDPNNLEIEVFFSLINKITNLTYINLDNEEVYENFCADFSEKFQGEILDFSKEFLLDHMKRR